MTSTRSTLFGWLALAAAIIAVTMRLVPHPANFFAIGALGLFSGAKLGLRSALMVPLGAMLVSDLALWMLTGFDFLYSPLHISRVYVYGSFLLYVAIGRLLRQRESWGVLLGASLAGSLQFFFVTNFCDWLCQPLLSEELLPSQYRYSRDFSGLLTCFAAALPFFRADFPWDFHAFVMVGDPRYGVLYNFLGDLIFTFGFFGLARVAEQAARANATEERTLSAADI